MVGLVSARPLLDEVYVTGSARPALPDEGLALLPGFCLSAQLHSFLQREDDFSLKALREIAHHNSASDSVLFQSPVVAAFRDIVEVLKERVNCFPLSLHSFVLSTTTFFFVFLSGAEVVISVPSLHH